MRKLVTIMLCITVAACAGDAAQDNDDTTDGAATDTAAATTGTTQTVSDDVGGTRVETYECGELRFTVRIENAMATIELPDRTLQLPHSSTSTGSRYTDGSATFWENNGRANIELPEGSHYDCEIAALPVDTVSAR